MDQEPQYFIVTAPMYAYEGVSGRGAVQLTVGRVYEATQVCKAHLVLEHPHRPGRPLYLPLKSAWWWARLTFAPTVEKVYTMIQ